MFCNHTKRYSKSWLGFNRIMILEVLSIAVSLGVMYIVWHSLYTRYKEKEWRRNNPDEYEWLERPVKKDKGL